MRRAERKRDQVRAACREEPPGTRPARSTQVCPGSGCEREVGQLLADAQRFLDGILRIGGSDGGEVFDVPKHPSLALI